MLTPPPLSWHKTLNAKFLVYTPPLEEAVKGNVEVLKNDEEALKCDLLGGIKGRRGSVKWRYKGVQGRQGCVKGDADALNGYGKVLKSDEEALKNNGEA